MALSWWRSRPPSFVSSACLEASCFGAGPAAILSFASTSQPAQPFRGRLAEGLFHGQSLLASRRRRRRRRGRASIYGGEGWRGLGHLLSARMDVASAAASCARRSGLWSAARGRSRSPLWLFCWPGDRPGASTPPLGKAETL